MLNIDHKKADLSRRAVFYEMPGFSLREYVNIKTGNSFDAISFEDILAGHLDLTISGNLTSSKNADFIVNDIYI